MIGANHSIERDSFGSEEPICAEIHLRRKNIPTINNTVPPKINQRFLL